MQIFLIAAQSVDGFITRHDIPGSGFSSPEDKTYFTRTLASCDCSVMGGETYRVSRDFILPRLTKARLRVVLTRRAGHYASEAQPGALEFTSQSAPEIVADLEKREYRRCALLGGSQIYGLFMEAGLVDELWLTIEPRLFGSGTPLLAKRIDSQLELMSNERLGTNTLLLKYSVLKNP